MVNADVVRSIDLGFALLLGVLVTCLAPPLWLIASALHSIATKGAEQKDK